MIAGLRRWLRGDDAADRRIKTLEGELDAMRMVVAAGREVYLRRVETCADCAFCNASPASFADLPDYELGDLP
jgi:hypothetical protein